MNSPANIFSAGDAVRGSYFGQPFTGTVTSSRFHTLIHDQQEVHITLDPSAVVIACGEPQARVCVEPKMDGRDGPNCSLYKVAA